MYKQIFIFILLGVALPVSVIAQTDNNLEPTATSDSQSQPSLNQTQTTEPDASSSDESWLTWAWGTPQQNSVYLGMFTLHFNHNSREEDRWSNNLVGGVYHGIFFGTLINSFDDRAFVVGFSRDIYQKNLTDNWNMTAGYRLGLISGYNEDMMTLAKYTPVLPFPQAYLDFTYHNVAGVEFSYIGVVVTAEFYFRF